MTRGFASDNTGPVHPAVLAALADVNSGPAPAYGDDQWTARAVEWFRGQFGDDTHPFLVWNGTGANVLALRAMTRPHQAVLCAVEAHMNVDECAAPELHAACKLIALPTPDAKLTPVQVRHAVRAAMLDHQVPVRVLSVTQPTEYGTVYTPTELAELCEAAHELGMLVHMDGARVANAAASLDLPLRAFTRDVGVDALSFGGTKNGALSAEAVIFFRRELAVDMGYMRKQSSQLSSKMRYLAAQFLALGTDDLWLANARHANAMARRLADGVRGISWVNITHPVEANAVFATLPRDITERLQRDFQFYTWNDEHCEVRWMTCWATTANDVDELVSAVSRTP